MSKPIVSTLTDSDTLKEAKAFLRENWEAGATCPCCTQNVKKYPRPIHGSMAYLLIRLYKLDRNNPDYYHVTQIYDKGKSNGSDDFSKFQVWGMIEQRTKEDGQKGRTSGYWKITEKGRQWVRGEITVPSHAYMFNKKCYGFSEDGVTIREALGIKFDYEELINS